MRLTKICGIPVRIIYRRGNNTSEIHPREGELLPWQRRVIAGWMEHQGHHVQGLAWSYVPVQGDITRAFTL
jgi:hypothetical protein